MPSNHCACTTYDNSVLFTEYMAPEVLFEEMYDGKSADIWCAHVILLASVAPMGLIKWHTNLHLCAYRSCGVSLYVMLTGDATTSTSVFVSSCIMYYGHDVQ